MQLRKLLRVASRFIFTLIVIMLFLMAPFSYAAPGDETTYYLLTDHLGSVDVILDEEGDVVERRDYLPYGSAYTSETTVEAPETDHKFTGKELDPETDLYYYGARYYDPLISRFTASDPWAGDLTNPQSLNKYSYVLNNPVIFIDPTGMYVMESGEVEEGDTLGGITHILNSFYRTSYSVGDIATINNIADPDKIAIGQRVRIGTLDGWQPPETGTGLNQDYYDSLDSRLKKKIFHYHTSFYQNDLPPTVSDMIGSEWYGGDEAVAHNIGTSGNLDYRGVGTRSGQQAIYDANDKLVTSYENKGTFDLEPPGRFGGNADPHLQVDVGPWLDWGNSGLDTTTRAQRIDAMNSSFLGRVGLYKLGIIKFTEVIMPE